MTKTQVQQLNAERDTESQIEAIAHEMVAAGVEKGLTLSTLQAASVQFLETFSRDRRVRVDRRTLELRAGLIAEKVLAASALSIVRELA